MLRIREVAQPDAAAAAEVRRPSAAASAAASAEIIRDFDDPYLELVRLLREAAEIEHALMVQYLYGAYSLKPAYIGIRGFSAPSPMRSPSPNRSRSTSSSFSSRPRACGRIER